MGHKSIQSMMTYLIEKKTTTDPSRAEYWMLEDSCKDETSLVYTQQKHDDPDTKATWHIQCMFMQTSK